MEVKVNGKESEERVLGIALRVMAISAATVMASTAIVSVYRVYKEISGDK